MHVSQFIGADESSLWDKITQGGRALVDTSLKVLDKTAPIINSYYDKEAARYNARAATSGGLFPSSITNRFPDQVPWGPIALGVGVVGVFAVIAAKRRRRR